VTSCRSAARTVVACGGVGRCGGWRRRPRWRVEAATAVAGGGVPAMAIRGGGGPWRYEAVAGGGVPGGEGTPAAAVLRDGGGPERRRTGLGQRGRSPSSIAVRRRGEGGGNEEKKGAGGGLGVPRAESTVFCGTKSTELT
jgi:hypothetical protein